MTLATHFHKYDLLQKPSLPFFNQSCRGCSHFSRAWQRLRVLVRILIDLFRPDFVIGQSLLAKLTGLTTICISTDCTVDLVWGHTTDSMCIGYMAEQDKKPKVRKVLYSLRKHPFFLALRRWKRFTRNVPSDEERGETDVFTG